MVILIQVLLFFSIWVLPFILARRGWSSAAIGYTVGAIFTVLINTFLAVSGPSENIIRIPSIEVLLIRLPLETLSLGTFLWGIIALIRKLNARMSTKKAPHEEPERTWECPRCEANNPNTTYTCQSCGYRLM